MVLQDHRNTLANLSKRTEVRSASFGHWLLGICCCLLVWSGGYSVRAHAEETTADGLRFQA